MREEAIQTISLSPGKINSVLPLNQDREKEVGMLSLLTQE
jgi:hypothetical protein